MKIFMKLLPLLVTVALVGGFHHAGTLLRGYQAVGGEIVFCAIAPLWYALAHDGRRYKRLKERKESAMWDEYSTKLEYQQKPVQNSAFLFLI